MRSWEKRTGVSLEERLFRFGNVLGSSRSRNYEKKYLVKTCWLVLDGAGFEEPWPMSIYVVFFSRAWLDSRLGWRFNCPNAEPLVSSRKIRELEQRGLNFSVSERSRGPRKTLGLCKHRFQTYDRAENLPFVLIVTTSSVQHFKRRISSSSVLFRESIWHCKHPW